MSDYLKPTQEKRTNWKTVAGLSAIGIGLSLFCNPSSVGNALRADLKNLFSTLIHSSGESEEAKLYLEYIPEDEAHELATWINNGVKTNKGKPHLNMLSILESAYSIVMRGNSLKKQ